MEGIEKIYQFLNEAGTYYLATTEGDQSRVRPFGTALLYDGRLYILFCFAIENLWPKKNNGGAGFSF